MLCVLGTVDTELDLADRLGQLMREKKFTQSSLSRASGVPQPTINRILARVTKDPRRESVVRMADCLNISPEVLYGSGHKGSAHKGSAHKGSAHKGSAHKEKPNQSHVKIEKIAVEKYPFNAMEPVESIYNKVAALDPEQREKLVDKIIANLM